MFLIIANSLSPSITDFVSQAQVIGTRAPAVETGMVVQPQVASGMRAVTLALLVSTMPTVEASSLLRMLVAT